MKYLKDFERSTNLLVEMFCKKQDTYVEHIVVDDITGVYGIGDNFFSLSDIYFDMKENKPKGLIFEWQNYVTDHRVRHTSTGYINYSSYCNGARFKTR
jgi:hypothetical protein